MSEDEKMRIQREYDRLVEYFGRPDNPASEAAFALHERIMRILRGEEPMPADEEQKSHTRVDGEW